MNWDVSGSGVLGASASSSYEEGYESSGGAGASCSSGG